MKHDKRIGLLALAVLTLAKAPAVAGETSVTVTKSPSCGCCQGWVDHMIDNGYEVRVIETEDLTPVKHRLGVPDSLGSCHTAEIGGYVIEGHVPAATIGRLLAEKPRVSGIAAPGMPQGSPGMAGEREPFMVMSFGPAGILPFQKID
ncbi:DUF411 domain-containing protein [Rhodospirillum rubrum]|uniref:Metal-binding protein n=1 Tax=Rhodospirillum rubrum (strain ATCC 11170 / ATH 1.1.1 / DSM 467 / LMG 4362 / NCIMB 8255 / S1) TaxID=269796 RepID=Q2RTQ0_RHORT|nr:DUF411 domain-containing protein [Rhodospirillum rubrum]ABC22495.1 Protein of unknown function DUF411 [Rhodospirillum rubrum ATCC 11170]AEO48213.1 hypothetical protein F11_08735 [Rhodospirillum rubrum F11]MBK5954083.1 metal-binding protein [Rhodospirillum rubrum]QXG82125.1 DUF411 domain-containing protein [Rhodospirillum rubrum]HAQ00181.1 metal-binding protein [Rhodospirillum rubrum]